MNQSRLTRRDFLNVCGLTALPTVWCDAADIDADQKPKLRFAVASDLHYAQPETPFDETTGNMVAWLNDEKKNGLDAIFLNGDLTHDSSLALQSLRDKHLAKLKTPYYAIKGNHDFLDPKPDSPIATWEKVWGYPANHVIKQGDFVFILADTSAPHSASTYLAVDEHWLKQQLVENAQAAGIFIFIHIAQREEGVDGWPKFGVHRPEEVKKGAEVMQLLESSDNVRAVFHGHNHNEIGHLVSGEQRYFFDSHIGGSWGAKKGYRVVEIYDDHRMVTYQWNAEGGKIANKDEIPK
jgi:3',5'-cyclic AMP phosphodiesterase CpdA